jgi:hypothetical protein
VCLWVLVGIERWQQCISAESVCSVLLHGREGGKCEAGSCMHAANMCRSGAWDVLRVCVVFLCVLLCGAVVWS